MKRTVLLLTFLVFVLTSCLGEGGVKKRYEITLPTGEVQILEYQRCSASHSGNLIGGAQVLNVHCYTNTENNWENVDVYDGVAISLREIPE